MSWSRSSALTSAAPTSSASTGWTARTAFTVVADIGAFSLANPPTTPFFVPTGVQYALQAYRGGFLVTDGHHNRVLRVTLDGEVSELIAFGNIVPTGLEVWGSTVYMAEAGPDPAPARNGKVVSFRPKSPRHRHAGGRRRAHAPRRRGVRSRSHALRPLAGRLAGGDPRARPRCPNTGSLVRVKRDGTFAVVASGLNQPTSLEFIRNTAYVVTLGGEIWKIDNVR